MITKLHCPFCTEEIAFSDAHPTLIAEHQVTCKCPKCGTKFRIEAVPEWEREYQLLQKTLRDFKDRMFARANDMLNAGKTGWNDPEAIPDRQIVDKMLANVATQDWVDVACYAAFAQYRKNNP